METTLPPHGRKVKDSPYGCHDCGCWSDDYMVHDEVWLEAWPGYRKARSALHREARAEADPEGTLRKSDPEAYRVELRKHQVFLVLCFNCLEERLGRGLRLEDFKERAPINRGIFLGAALRVR